MRFEIDPVRARKGHSLFVQGDRVLAEAVSRKETR